MRRRCPGSVTPYKPETDQSGDPRQESLTVAVTPSPAVGPAVGPGRSCSRGGGMGLLRSPPPRDPKGCSGAAGVRALLGTCGLAAAAELSLLPRRRRSPGTLGGDGGSGRTRGRSIPQVQVQSATTSAGTAASLLALGETEARLEYGAPTCVVPPVPPSPSSAPSPVLNPVENSSRWRTRQGRLSAGS